MLYSRLKYMTARPGLYIIKERTIIANKDGAWQKAPKREAGNRNSPETMEIGDGGIEPGNVIHDSFLR